MTKHYDYFLKGFLFILLAFCTGCRHNEPEVPSFSALRISSEGDPQTLDPRQVRDLPTATIIHMLYEGLMRIDETGHPQPAIAESVTVSPDQKIYTFKLRKAHWSDGQPLTAKDFELTWKSVLDPQFPAPNAYQFYLIKNAKQAKEGQASLDEVGIEAVDDETLVVELDYPAPYFLNLTATYFYYPVNEALRKQGSQIEKIEENFVANGPFQLDHWSRHNELTVSKNPYYWDKEQVKLDQIIIAIVDNPTSLQMFGRNELDWTGSPLSTIPTDAIVTLKRKGDLQIRSGAGTFWFRLNTEREPFNHPKMRQAFSLAFNRQELVDHVLKGNQVPAVGIIPPALMKNISLFNDYDTTTARRLFQEALDEQKLTRSDLPTITLCYATGERSHKIAQVAQQNWKQALGVEVQLETCESKIYYDRLKNQDYQISIGSWFADIWDPISFLEVFKFKNNGTNNTQWENPNFIRLLDLSSQTSDSLQREKFLKQAEHVLVRDMPIIPLFYSSYNYLKQPFVKNVYFSELGYLDFKRAYIERPSL